MKKQIFNSEKNSDKKTSEGQFTDKDFERVFSKIMSDPKLVAHLEKIRSANK